MPPEFSLQPVLDYRHNLAQAMEIELGRRLATQQAHQARLAHLNDNRMALFAELRRRQSGELVMSVVNQLRQNLRGLEREIENEQAALTQASLAVLEQQQKVVAARQDEEALEKLKANGQERFRQGQARHEEHQRDDIYIAQAHRRAAEAAAGGLL